MKIGEKGQITIPKDLREKYGFFPSIEIEIISEDGGIKIQKKKNIGARFERCMGFWGKKIRPMNILRRFVAGDYFC